MEVSLKEELGKISIDIYEKDGNVVILAPLAGVSSKDVEIVIKKDVLIIKGVRRQPEEVGKDNYLRQECFWGSFQRQLLLPHHLDTSKIKAKLINGLLMIKIPIEKPKSTIIHPQTEDNQQ